MRIIPSKVTTYIKICQESSSTRKLSTKTWRGEKQGWVGLKINFYKKLLENIKTPRRKISIVSKIYILCIVWKYLPERTVSQKCNMSQTFVNKHMTFVITYSHINKHIVSSAHRHMLTHDFMQRYSNMNKIGCNNDLPYSTTITWRLALCISHTSPNCL